jgi:hypothetical protein
MRRYIIMAISVSIAPVRADPALNISARSGLNTATLEADHRFNRYGFSGGLGGHVQWTVNNWFLAGGQLEFLYTPRGAEVVLGGERLGRCRQHYSDLIVSARPEVRIGRLQLYLLLGGGLNLLLSASKEDTTTGEIMDITDDLRRIDVALLAGAGVAWHLPRGTLGAARRSMVFLEARHDQGLIDTDPAGGFRNRTSSVMLGLSLALAPRAPSGRTDLSSTRSAATGLPTGEGRPIGGPTARPH